MHFFQSPDGSSPPPEKNSIESANIKEVNDTCVINIFMVGFSKCEQFAFA